MKTTPARTNFNKKQMDPVVPEMADREPTDGNEPLPFLIVAIGASAGGLEAFTELLRTLPPDTGMAFILIQHLDPKHRSILSELISKETRMPAAEVSNGMQLERNHVYVIPPNASMTLSDHTLRLEKRQESTSVHMPIDHFMRSLAQMQGKRAIGVLLSGSGTDGTLGMAEIQANGGVTFAQDAESAKFQDMPRSAIQANCVDYILPPRSIAQELARIAHHPYIETDPQAEPAELGTSESRSLNSIFQLLRKSAGVDFTNYRKTTILRRIQRRMVVHKLDRIEDYVRYVHSNPAEIALLYKDMLINVTSFFRNPVVFDALKAHVFAALLKNRESETPVRIWTPGCASGEETYSVAIALLEYLGDKAPQVPIQLFGTDLSESSIVRARSGFYPENIQVDVSPERLQRFFNKVEGGYRISKTIRDMCIFAQHNILNDPPFSQIDLICCRNLFIYLEPELQHRVLALFHYSLRQNGYLVMGTSEGVGSSTDLFSTEDRVNKIFAKKKANLRALITFSVNPRIDQATAGLPTAVRRAMESTSSYMEMQKDFDRRLLSQYAPPAVFVTEDLEIVHTRGDVSQYLALSSGRPSLSLLKMAPEGMLLDLRNAITRAKKELRPVRRENVRIKRFGLRKGTESRGHVVNFEVVPLRMTQVKQLYLMLIFEEARGELRPEDGQRNLSTKQKQAMQDRSAKLEQDLAATKEYLQSVIESQEATNEELQSANEEILSSNEELQSTNEELETAKEELQSANEELATVNDELRSRNSEIVQVNNDLTTLLYGIDLAVVLVGSDLTLRRFTPAAEKLLGLIPADVGRPILNINPTLQIPDFQSMIARVMSEARPAQKQLADQDHRQFKLRITPYRASDGQVNGCVITIVDISTSATAWVLGSQGGS